MKFSFHVLLLAIFFLFIGGISGDIFEASAYGSISRRLSSNINSSSSEYTYQPGFKIVYDPPFNSSSPTSLGVFVRAQLDGVDVVNAKIYYFTSDKQHIVMAHNLTTEDSYTTYNSPIIQLITPFKAERESYLSLIATLETTDSEGVEIKLRSNRLDLLYNVEAGPRKFAYGFLIPGIESNGYFIRFGMEIEGKARAQAAGGQEFADFDTNLGIGTYLNQVNELDLMSLNESLTGFEGGFPVNATDGKHFGFLIPYHNGEEFFGKVVRVDLKRMGYDETPLGGVQNYSSCIDSYRYEKLLPNGSLYVYQSNDEATASEACVFVIDLTSLHINARGFRRGFVQFPYGYLSPGEHSVAVRIDVDNFGIHTTRVVDLSIANKEYGGYSGGFADGSWACYCPYRSYSGPVGGIRSTLPVDAARLKPYFQSVMVCMNDTVWDLNSTAPSYVHQLRSAIQVMDFSTMKDDLRGFSDVLRMGRYAYLSPLNSADHVYATQLIRISLGSTDIGTTLRSLNQSGLSIRSIVDVLDLSKKDTRLKGFSGMFTSGKYLFLVPYRNAYEPANGQRGHGCVTRLDMNDFSLDGIDFMDMPTTKRNQIPSFADVGLRGYAAGFASGRYGVLVPFYNAVFNGKIARFQTVASTLTADLQQLDLVLDRMKPNIYKGYRGGFASLWQGVPNIPD